MMTENNKEADEARIRALIIERLKAVRVKEINAATANTAPGIVSFDVHNALQHLGAEACRRRAQEWFSTFQGPIGYDIRDLIITVGADVAFSHSLNRVTGMKTGGEKVHMYLRVTTCYRKVDDQWLIVHEHISVPYDARTGKASVDLKP